MGLSIRGKTITALGLVMAAAVSSTCALSAGTDRYPSQTIKIVVPLPPGTTADVIPRLLADKLSADWGHPVIVENRPGAALHIGAEAVARAEPTGYTLLATPSGPLTLSPHLFPKLGFDPAAFVPISIMVEQPTVIVANRSAPYSTLQELIAYARVNPGKVNYGSPGTGTSLHLIAEMLQLSTGIHLTHVPYKGMAPAMTDLLSGHISITVDVLGNALPYIRSGKLKALAVTGKGRIDPLPNVPAVAESIPGFVFTERYVMVGPPRMAAETADKLSAAIAAAVRLPDIAQRLSDLSVVPVGASPQETAEFLKEETEHWRQVVRSTGVKLE
jgi:tripartite-type tricarboxylate transporter receptor subunit TctC